MTTLQTILGTTKTYIDALNEAWIHSIEDFLFYFPRTYTSHNKSDNFSDLRWDQINNFRWKVCTTTTMQTKSWRKLFKCVIEDNQWVLAECVWFNRPYFWESLIEWKVLMFIWKAKLEYWRLQIMSPKVDFFWEKSVHTWDIIPVYSQIWEKLTPEWIREKMNRAIWYVWVVKENLPDLVISQEKLIGREDSIKKIHFPSSQEDLDNARERLAFEELYELQLESLERKEEVKAMWEKEDLVIKMDSELIKRFFSILPFIPTNAQKIAIYQILKDMESPYPMHRLLEWDVWSWKTLVALSSSLPVINNWKQVAFMAPTEVLARQHFAEVSKYIDNIEENLPELKWVFRPWLLIWAMTPKQKKETVAKLVNREINLLIWTHALISEYVEFDCLWLAIIDEQHKFGVMQREKLKSHWLIHVLYMTATPIPRTLALVAYWDQDISVLNEMPKWRQPIETKVITPSGRNQIYRIIESEIEKWRQVYVICPLVTESQNLEAKAATQEYKRLKQEVFPALRLSLIHWQLKPKEKDDIMKQFKDWKSDILVSTSVVEVWVDVPNATTMLIEWAERFWLAQLHQLRWRVWRSKHKSFCFLFTTDNKNDLDRLRAMEKYSDWFTLSEIDMKLRWPWEVYWVRQSWIPDLRMASMSDHKMVLRARKAAEEYLWIRWSIN